MKLLGLYCKKLLRLSQRCFCALLDRLGWHPPPCVGLISVLDLAFCKLIQLN